MTRSKRRSWVLCGAFSVLLGFANVVVADPLKLSVDVIEAGKGTEEIDPRLRSVTQTLRTTFPHFTRFKLRAHRLMSLSRGEPQRLELPDQLTAELTLDAESDSEVALQVSLPQKNALIRVQSKRGELFFQAFVWRKKTYLLAVIAQ